MHDGVKLHVGMKDGQIMIRCLISRVVTIEHCCSCLSYSNEQTHRGDYVLMSA